MSNEERLGLLRRVFSDVARGFTIGFLKNKPVYIKHLSHHDQVDLEIIHKGFVDKAVRDGVPTEKEMLEVLKDGGVWSDDDESELEGLKKVIQSETDNKANAFLKAQVDNQNEAIKKAEEEYCEKASEREKCVGITAESYADKQINRYYISRSLYKDEGFITPLLDQSSEESTDGNLRAIVSCYNISMEDMQDGNLKRLAIQDFYQLYWIMSGENLYHFFGLPICNLSHFQIRLASFSKTFGSLLQEIENVPDHIREDPDALMDYVKMAKEGRKKMENTREDAAVSIVGATKEDYKAMGYDTSNSTTFENELKKKKDAGNEESLNMHDIMNLMGV